MMQKGDEVTLNIDNLSGDGKTVARLDGMVYFVDRAVPGDIVRARVWKVKKNFADARAVEVLTPSPFRTAPKCKHFGVCGGCKWQDLAYEAQLRFKHKLVVDAFERIGGFVDPVVHPVLGCEDPYFYRNKMEFTFSNYRWLTDEEVHRKEPAEPAVALGLHVPERYDKVVNLEECWLQSELSAAIVNTIREVCKVWNLSVYSTETQEGYMRHLVIREGKRTGDVMVNLVTSADWPEGMAKLSGLLCKQFPQITTIVNNITTRRSMVARGEVEKVYHGPGTINEKLGEYSFRLSANSFFQTNTLQAERLYETVRTLANLTSRDVVYDLYCGTGTIAIYLSQHVDRVVGIELVASSIADAMRNAEVNRVGNCFFLQGDLKDRLTTDRAWIGEHPRPTVIVTDPPRSGMHPKVVEQIVKSSPERVVYVSCNPSTQARDAKLLAGSGYVLKEIQPVDMFPHTDHVEAVGLFVKK